MCEELEAMFSDFETVNMDDPMNKSLAAGIALPFIKSLDTNEQIGYVQRLCKLCKIDPIQLKSKM